MFPSLLQTGKKINPASEVVGSDNFALGFFFIKAFFCSKFWYEHKKWTKLLNKHIIVLYRIYGTNRFHFVFIKSLMPVSIFNSNSHKVFDNKSSFNANGRHKLSGHKQR